MKKITRAEQQEEAERAYMRHKLEMAYLSTHVFYNTKRERDEASKRKI